MKEENPVAEMADHHQLSKERLPLEEAHVEVTTSNRSKDVEERRSRPSSPTTHQVIIKSGHRSKSSDHESFSKKVMTSDIGSQGFMVSSSSSLACKDQATRSGTSSASADDNGRERLKRHRTEMAGRVWIPDIWGQEDLLKDWIDCSAFDAGLMPSGIISARNALIEEGRRASSGGLRIENRC